MGFQLVKIKIVAALPTCREIIYDIIKLSSDELKLQMSELESFGGGSMRNEHFLFFKKRE